MRPFGSSSRRRCQRCGLVEWEQATNRPSFIVFEMIHFRSCYDKVSIFIGPYNWWCLHSPQSEQTRMSRDSLVGHCRPSLLTSLNGESLSPSSLSPTSMTVSMNVIGVCATCDCICTLRTWDVHMLRHSSNLVMWGLNSQGIFETELSSRA